MSDTIIAIDLGRYKSVACVYDRRTLGPPELYFPLPPDENHENTK